MYRAFAMIVTIGLMLGTQALATESKNRAAMNRRQLLDCMNRQMVANKALSYNAAVKVCNDQMKVQTGQGSVTARAAPADPR
ncbi:MAG: hypothetical protein WA624_18275 [Methylocella sp.]